MTPELEQALTQEFNTLRGRVCGFLEAIGLPEKQERGAIQTFKSLTYDSQKAITELLRDA